jgi:hypothetical protein
MKKAFRTSRGTPHPYRIAFACAFAALPAVAAEPQLNDDLRSELRQRLEEESKALETLSRSLREQEKKLAADREALAAQKRRIEALERRILRNGENEQSSATNVGEQALAGEAGRGDPNAPPTSGAPSPTAQGSQAGGQAQPGAQAAPPPPPPQGGQAPQSIGQAPQRTDTRPPEVAPIFQAPGVLTPKGRLVLEPSLQYDYSTNNRVAIAGFSILPAINIGLIDVRTVNRSVWTAALTTRYGITNRFEIEGRLPYVYRRDTTVARPFGKESATDQAFDADGNGIGDVELTGRYQINEGGMDKPYYIGTLRLKTRTGKSPFEVETFSPFAGSGVLQKELPTGSGFYGLQPGLTVIYPTDPAVFFGSATYMHNFKRNVGGGFGEIDPGDIYGFNFGMGLALNEKASFSVGYDHSIVSKLKQDGVVPPASTSSQLGTLLLGYSFRTSLKTTWSLSLGIGATKDAPDVQLRLRVPTSFIK